MADPRANGNGSGDAPPPPSRPMSTVQHQHFFNLLVEDRNQLMAEKRDMMIAMDPVMAQKFASSTHISRNYRPDSPLD